MALDLSSLSTDDIAVLKAALGMPNVDANGRSPLRPRQLHDLRLLPTKDDPRPTFFWSAEAPRDAADLTKTSLYPRLMWESTTGREITVVNAKDQASYTAQGFVLVAPANAETLDPSEMIRQQLEQLSPEDRKTIIAAAQKDRMARLQEAMAGLTEDELAALVASVEPSKARRTA
jgi:hypothetical protein